MQPNRYCNHASLHPRRRDSLRDKSSLQEHIRRSSEIQLHGPMAAESVGVPCPAHLKGCHAKRKRLSAQSSSSWNLWLSNPDKRALLHLLRFRGTHASFCGRSFAHASFCGPCVSRECSLEELRAPGTFFVRQTAKPASLSTHPPPSGRARKAKRGGLTCHIRLESLHTAWVLSSIRLCGVPLAVVRPLAGASGSGLSRLSVPVCHSCRHEGQVKLSQLAK